MFISDTKTNYFNRKFRKTILVYIFVTFTVIGVNLLYGLFGHGVSSSYMTWMFLYPLGAAVFFFGTGTFAPRIISDKSYRTFYNCLNSGVAACTTGSFLKGILDIAGTASAYTKFFFIVGWLFIIGSLAMLIVSTATVKKL